MSSCPKFQLTNVCQWNKYKRILLFACDSPSAGRLILRSFRFHVRSNACQFRVYHNAAAIFANNDFLARTDVQLTLRRNFVEATAASIALHIDNAQTVARILTDTFERLQEARFYFSFQFLGFIAQFFFLLFGFCHNLVQLVSFGFQVFGALF